MYKIELTSSSEKQLYKLPSNVQSRIVKVLERCRVRPHAYAKKLVGSPHFRIRVGYYRIIVDIQGSRMVILVLEIDHRKRIYK